MIDPKALLEYDGPDRIVHFTEYLKLKAAEPQEDLFHSAFKQFDERLNGLSAGELTVLSGGTGQGKTLFAESWMKGLLDKNIGLKACLFSFEVPPKTLLEKYAGSPQLSLYLPMELKMADFEWIYQRVWEAAVKENVRLFVFDHLHFLIDLAEKQNMSLNIGKFMRELKWKIAMELHASVILIAHQKNVPKGEEPSLEDIRDSSFITQEADNVILCWRRKNFTPQELDELQKKNPVAVDKITQRLMPFPLSADEYSDQFAMIQVSKGRRNGAFRWNKLFQKVGPWLEEV